MARGLIIAAAIAVVAGACGGSPVLDSDSLEAAVAEMLVPEAPEAVTGVECPEVIVEGPVEIGCVALIGGVPVEVAVSIAADDTAAISTDANVVAVGDMEAEAAARLSLDLGVDTSVSCPGPRVLVSLPGTVLECDATDPSGAVHEVIISIRSDQGDWELSLA